MTTATILPPARTVFVNANGTPLVGGKVYFYVPPATSTPKTTWQDAGEITPNSNPVTLDSNGSALIYGSGQYYMVVHDILDNLIWDGLTQDLLGLVSISSGTLAGDNTWTGINTYTNTVILEGDSVAVTRPDGDATTHIATTEFVNATPLTLADGTTAVTQIFTDNSTKVATTAFVNSANLVHTVNQILITSSGTYTPSAGLIFAIIEVLGGGGGGGGSSGSGTLASGAGGGAGAYSRSRLSAATIGASQSVTIGAAGSAGVGGGAGGGTGGTTSFGALIICSGGVGGASALGAPGIGGTASAGDLQSPGGTGISALLLSNTISTGGNGANSQYGGGGGPTLNSATNGFSGVGYGSGGGGGVGASGAGGGNGGVGTAGIIIVTEFCNQ